MNNWEDNRHHTADEFKRANRSRRSDNRKQSAKYLDDHGILFTTNNHGAHLMVEGSKSMIDFWPGTGRWKSRKGKEGFGVRKLVKDIGEEVI